MLSTTALWSTVLLNSMKAQGIDNVPSQEAKKFQWIVFYMAIIILCSFFLLNLFVGVVISTFNREKEKIGGNNLLT